MDSTLKVIINPPPNDRCCECCGRHVDRLKPFGGPGDPLNGDFKGAYLVKTFRGFMGTTSASWECRDCIILSPKSYRQKLNRAFKRRCRDKLNGFFKRTNS